MTAIPPPWLESSWQPMGAAIAKGRLAHALLLIGPAGAGKRAFARQLAGAIVCRQRLADGRACGSCASCRMFAAGNHPDVFRLEKEEGSKVLKIDDLREFNRRLFLTAQPGGGRVGLIDPAHELTNSAANALLKSLEEPPPGAHTILVSERWHRLPATVRSRCQIIRFTLPASTDAKRWLESQTPDDPELAGLRRRYAHDAVAARAWLDDFTAVCAGKDDPVLLAQQWQALGEQLPDLLERMHGWTREMLRVKAGAAVVTDEGLPPALRRVAAGTSGSALHQLAGLVIETRALLDTQAKPQTLLENLLASWYQTLNMNARAVTKAAS